jgi:hypothetical protein
MTRPSFSAIVATVAASCVLGAGGYLLGKGPGPGRVPAAVPVQASKQPRSAAPIVVPPDVTLPRR